jgi:hypothetical protein
MTDMAKAAVFQPTDISVKFRFRFHGQNSRVSGILSF